MDIEKAKYIKTTAKKVKQAIEDLIETVIYPSPVKVSVKPYKSTKYFEIYVDIDMDIQWTVDEEDIQHAVDHYFDEDQHNQYDVIRKYFPSSDVAIEIVDPYLNYGLKKSVTVKKAQQKMEEILQDVYAKKEKPTAKPKMVCDGNKCRRVPTKKKEAATKKSTPKKGKKKSAKKKDGRLSAREYVEEYGGKEGDVCDVRNDGELKCLLFRKNKSPYWSKLDAPKAREVMACSQGKSCRK